MAFNPKSANNLTKEGRAKGLKNRYSYFDNLPEGFKPCTKCNVVKPINEFYKNPLCKFGVNGSCKICAGMQKKQQYAGFTEEYKLYHSAKSRAAEKGIEFSIEVSDIIIPKYCPILNIELKKKTIYAPSIDRVDSTRGYIKDNICVMSRRANTLKNNGTIEEFEAIIKFLKEIVDIGK